MTIYYFYETLHLINKRVNFELFATHDSPSLKIFVKPMDTKGPHVQIANKSSR